MNPFQYNISVRQVVVDDQNLFEARVAELPDLVEYGDTSQEAYDLAIDSIETAAEMYAEKGRLFPAPRIIEEDFSGRVTLRLPRSLHRSLSEKANDEDVSLNQFLVSILSCFSGFSMPNDSAEAQGWLTFVEQSAPQDHRMNGYLRLICSNDLDQAANLDWK